MQVDDVFPAKGISERALRFVLFGAILGFPVALVFGWFYDLGGKKFEKKTDSADQQNQGLITSCKKVPDNKSYFYFANGQVWKQVGDRRLSFEECNFVATIREDLFGFKIDVEGYKEQFLVSHRK